VRLERRVLANLTQAPRLAMRFQPRLAENTLEQVVALLREMGQIPFTLELPEIGWLA
jgi:hypothetical protein